jgi:hypothetical protein
VTGTDFCEHHTTVAAERAESSKREYSTRKRRRQLRVVTAERIFQTPRLL